MNEDLNEHLLNSITEDDDPSQQKAYVALTGFFNSKFQYLPASFSDLLGDIPLMSHLAELMLSLLHTGNYSPLTEESIDKIELTIRELIQSQSHIYGSIQSTSTPHSMSIQNRAEQAEQSDLARLRTELIDLKGKCAFLQEEAKEHQNQVLGLQGEIEELYGEKVKLSRIITQQKREFNEEISKLHFESNALSEKYQDTLTKLKLLSGTESGLRTQLKLAHQESDECAKRNDKLTARISSKKEKNYQLKVQIKKQHIRIDELQAEIASMQISTSSTKSPNKNNHILINNYPNTSDENNYSNDNNSENPNFIMNKQKSQIENQAREIVFLKDALKDREATIDAQKKRIENQSDAIMKGNHKVEEMTQKFDSMKDEVILSNKRIKETQELLSSRAVELTQTRDILMKVSEQLNSGYTIQKLTDIPDIIDDLLTSQGEKTTTAQALSIIDGLTRFIDVMLMEDRTDANLLVDQVPIMGDRRLLNQITTNITKVKDFITEKFGASFPHIRLFDSLLSAKEHFMEDADNCEFAALVVVCAANERLRRLCIQQRSELENYAKVFPTDKMDDTRKLFNQYDRVCLQMFKEKFEDRLSMLSFFIDSIIAFNNRMKSEVEPVLNISCDFNDIPDNIVDTFSSLSSQIKRDQIGVSNANDASRNELQSSLSEVESELGKRTSEKKNLESTVKKLSKQLKTYKTSNEKLKEQLEDAKNTRSELEETFSTIHEKNHMIEENERSVRLERDRLQTLLDQRQQNFQARIDSLLQAERNNHNEEIARLQKLWLEERQNLLNQIDSKTEKFNSQRKIDRELIDYMEQKLKISNEIIKNHNLQPADQQIQQILQAQQSPKENASHSNDALFNSVIKELKRVVQVSGDWNDKKVISGIKKIVDTILRCDTEEKWRSWGMKLLNCDKYTKVSEIRNKISDSFKKQENLKRQNEALITEKQILTKYNIRSIESDKEKSANAVMRAVLFSIILKNKILSTKTKKVNM